MRQTECDALYTSRETKVNVILHCDIDKSYIDLVQQSLSILSCQSRRNSQPGRSRRLGGVSGLVILLAASLHCSNIGECRQRSARGSKWRLGWWRLRKTLAICFGPSLSQKLF
jgi:hypothetical protein